MLKEREVWYDAIVGREAETVNDGQASWHVLPAHLPHHESCEPSLESPCILSSSAAQPS